MALTIATHGGSGSPVVAMFGICSSTLPPYTPPGQIESVGTETGYGASSTSTVYVTTGVIATGAAYVTVSTSGSYVTTGTPTEYTAA